MQRGRPTDPPIVQAVVVLAALALLVGSRQVEFVPALSRAREDVKQLFSACPGTVPPAWPRAVESKSAGDSDPWPDTGGAPGPR